MKKMLGNLWATNYQTAEELKKLSVPLLIAKEVANHSTIVLESMDFPSRDL